MSLPTRVVAATDTATLDAIHALAVAGVRPEWACDPEPHPSRNQFDRIVRNPDRRLVVAEDEWGVAGYMAHRATDGLITAGGVRHGWLNGEGNQLDDVGLLIVGSLVDAVKANTGGLVAHASWRNPRMWYALEVQVLVPPSSAVWGEFGNKGAPPAPPEGPVT